MDNSDFPGKSSCLKFPRNVVLLPLICLAPYVINGADSSNAADVVGAGRTIKIVMKGLEFDPNFIEVRAGETIRFKLVNRDEIAHDFTIGSPAMQQARRSFIRVLHDAEELDPDAKMQQSHDHLNSVIVPPGVTKELVWTFKRTQKIEFGCNVPLHYEGGMKGKFNFIEPVSIFDSFEPVG